MSLDDLMLSLNVLDGLLAQRQLDEGEINTEEEGRLAAIISQGKRAEAILRRTGKEWYIETAHKHAHTIY